jgi:hypothetical protein
MKEQKAAVYFTASKGVSPSPGLPPMVPLMPEMERMSVIAVVFIEEAKVKFLSKAVLVCSIAMNLA